MHLLWDEIGQRLVVYLALLPFFGILASGSLDYFTVISGASETKLQAFLGRLGFPFKPLLPLFYGPEREVVGIILKSTRRSAMAMRIFGSAFPVALVIATVYNLLMYTHNTEDTVFSLGYIGLFLVTLVILWRFGHSLLSP